AKIKRPAEWIVAGLRATGRSGDIGRIVGGLNLLGEPLWRPPSPKGFPDDNAAWLQGLAQRLDIANTVAQRLGDQLDPAAVVAPIGDPDWRKLRGDKALTLDGPTPALPLDDFFALNPAMPNLHRLYRAGQALFVHAVATPYRERSHFDGQDVLQSGFAGPGT